MRMDVLRKGAVLRQITQTCLAIFLEVFVHSTLWMSLSLASLVPFVQLECGAAAFDWRPFWAGACESIAVYTLDHLRDIKKATASTGEHKVSHHNAFVARHRVKFLRTLMMLALAGFIGSLVAAHSWRVTATFVGHIALCVIYAKLKKKMPYLKAAYVSLCVVFMGVAAPASYAPGLLDALTPAVLTRICFLIFSVSFTVEHLQDLRDIDEDREAGVVTLPSGLGPRRARRMLLAVQASCLAVHGAMTWLGGLAPRPELLLVHIGCLLGALFFTQKTPRSLFQVALEPLYAAPLAAVAIARVVQVALNVA